MEGRRNYLIIDCDTIVLKLAAGCCHELGFKAYIADMPTEEFDELKCHRYRSMVIDHHVHGIAGFEFLDQLPSWLSRATIDVLTGDTSDQTRVRYETQGAMAFLCKPFVKACDAVSIEDAYRALAMEDDWGVFDLARYTENFAAFDGEEQCEIWAHLQAALIQALSSVPNKGLQSNIQIVSKRVLQFES